MPTKKSSSSPTKPAVAKKTTSKVSPKKNQKSVAEKTVTNKPAKKNTGKSKTRTTTKSIKPAEAKKIVTEARAEAQEAIAQAPVVTITEKRVEHAHRPVEIERRIVFIGTCSNCDHLPMRVSKLLMLMIVLVAVLSGLILSRSFPLQLESHKVVFEQLTHLFRNFYWL